MVTIYTTETCPKCKILKTKMNQIGIEYTECTDIDIMSSKEFLSVPMLEVNGIIMNFAEANTWINGRK